MIPIQRFWEDVHQIEAALPAGEVLWIASIKPPVRVMQALRRNCAVMVAQGTHRLAGAEEISEHLRRARILGGAEVAREECNGRKGGMRIC